MFPYMGELEDFADMGTEQFKCVFWNCDLVDDEDPVYHR
jgi:hypothetical protein